MDKTFIRNFKDERSETISETSTIKEDEEMSEEGSDDEDEVVHVECSVKAEPTEHQLVKSNDEGFLEAAVQEGYSKCGCYPGYLVLSNETCHGASLNCFRQVFDYLGTKLCNILDV